MYQWRCRNRYIIAATMATTSKNRITAPPELFSHCTGEFPSYRGIGEWFIVPRSALDDDMSAVPKGEALSEAAEFFPITGVNGLPRLETLIVRLTSMSRPPELSLSATC